MSFVNPIKILDLSGVQLAEITPALIKKAKRKVFADIDLSDDGLLTTNGISYTKQEVEKAVNQLDDQDYVEYYYFISNNKKLESFLTKADISLFENFTREPFYVLPEFINFISPFFAASFNKAILHSYTHEYLNTFKLLSTSQLLVTPPDRLKAFKSVIDYLNNQKNTLDEIVTELRNNHQAYTLTAITEKFKQYQQKIDAPKVNALPVIFSEQVNQLAISFRNLSVNIFNAHRDYPLSLEVIKYAGNFNTNGIAKDNITSDLTELLKLQAEDMLTERYSVILKKCIDINTTGRELIIEVDNKRAEGTRVINWANNKISTTEINSLPTGLDDPKNDIPWLLRSLAISLWNTRNDADSALRLLNIALQINSPDPAVGVKLREDKVNLQNLQIQHIARNHRVPTPTPIVQRPSNPVPKPSPGIPYSQKKSSGCGPFILAVIVIIVIVWIINTITINNASQQNSPSPATTVDTQTSTSTTTPVIADTTQKTLDTSLATSAPATVVADKYATNSLPTGSSPYSKCMGAGVYSGQSWLTVTNDTQNDAIVAIINQMTDGVIRHKYIRAGAIYKFREIPTGMYYLQVYSGTGWNPDLLSACGSYGVFENNVHYSSTVGAYNNMSVTDDGNQYSTFKLNLSDVLNKSIANETTLSSEFFNHIQ